MQLKFENMLGQSMISIARDGKTLAVALVKSWEIDEVNIAKVGHAQIEFKDRMFVSEKRRNEQCNHQAVVDIVIADESITVEIEVMRLGIQFCQKRSNGVFAVWTI